MPNLHAFVDGFRLACVAVAVTCGARGVCADVAVADIAASYQKYLEKMHVFSCQFEEQNSWRSVTGNLWLSKTGCRVMTLARFSQGGAELKEEHLRHDGTFLSVSKAEQDYTVFSVNDANASPSYGPHFGNDLSLLIGYFSLGSFDKTINVLTVLNNSQTRLIDSDFPEIVRCETDLEDCNVVLSFDKTRNFVLTQCIVEKRHPKMVADEVISYDARLKDFMLVDGVWLPTMFEMQSKVTATKPDDKKPDERVVFTGPNNRDWRLSNHFHGDHVEDKFFKIQTIIPDYTEVHVLDAPQIQHVWLDGKVVPLTDETALARARGHGFVPGAREPRFWLLVLSIAMILTAFGHMLYRRFHAKGEEE